MGGTSGRRHWHHLPSKGPATVLGRSVVMPRRSKDDRPPSLSELVARYSRPAPVRVPPSMVLETVEDIRIAFRGHSHQQR